MFGSTRTAIQEWVNSVMCVYLFCLFINLSFPLEYSLSQHDQESMIKGLEACVNILIAAGASEIGTVNGVESFSIDPKHPSPLTSPEFIQWKKKMIDVGIQKNRAMIGSAHQMGTCKMSSSPKTGVCSPKGETHEVKGLYVADASLFPTSSGVK